MEEANGVLESKFVSWLNERCTHRPASVNDAHREVGPQQDLAAILSVQESRHVGNDHTIHFENAVYQLVPPVWPGERGGKVIVEKRLDGSLHIRFKKRYLEYRALGKLEMGALPPNVGV